MAKKIDEPSDQLDTQEIEHLKKRLELLDQRLDNIDSIVTACVERVMKQPVTIYITCSHCGHRTEVALVGMDKPTK